MRFLVCLLLVLCMAPHAFAEVELFSPGQVIELLDKKVYRIQKILGNGTNGDIYQAQEVGGTDVVAIKVFVEEIEKESILESITQNYQYVQQLAHISDAFLNVKAFTDARIKGRTTDPEYFLVSVMTVAEGQNLLDVPKPFSLVPSLSEHEASQTLQRLKELIDFGVSSIQLLSSFELVHGDFNPKNIIYTKDGQLKLIDYEYMNHPETVTFNYDFEYAAYDSHNHEPVIGATDLYSLGMTVARFLVGESPLVRFSNKKRVESTDQGDGTDVPIEFIATNKNYHEEMIKDLLICLDKNSEFLQTKEQKQTYIEIANFVLNVLNFEPQDRGFHWRGVTYSHRAQVVNKPTFIQEESNNCDRVLH